LNPVPDKTAPDAAALIPVIVCPECGALEVAGFVGDSTGEIIAANREHFTDKSGFLYCEQCGAVWRSTYALEPSADIDPQNLPPTIFAQDKLGTGPGFHAADATNFRLFRKLGRLHARASSEKNPRAIRRASDRIYDAEALCAILDLPAETKAAVTFHIKIMAERADMRDLCNRLREDGKIRAVRSEAVTIATVALVMERFNIHRDNALEQMLASFHFNRGPPVITPEEYSVAYHACAAWFGKHLWKDGPEDHQNPKEGMNIHE
jgi:hypothetical protein